MGYHSVASTDTHCGGAELALRSKSPLLLGGGTILDNLTTLLSDDFEADKLNRMLAILGLDKMIAAAENGAAAMLGSKKGGVSGGEKQNITIVRQDRVGDVGVSAPTADR